MASLKVKTTLTQLFLQSVLTRLPEWKQGDFLQGGGVRVCCNSDYLQKLPSLVICCTVGGIPPALPVNSSVLGNHQ